MMTSINDYLNVTENDKPISDKSVVAIIGITSENYDSLVEKFGELILTKMTESIKARVKKSREDKFYSNYWETILIECGMESPIQLSMDAIHAYSVAFAAFYNIREPTENELTQMVLGYQKLVANGKYSDITLPWN